MTRASSSQALAASFDAPAAFATLDAMARLAGDSASVVHVVSPREPGIAERARILAIQADLDVSVDLLPTTVRVRFSPRS
jgi:hypothetical protein